MFAMTQLMSQSALSQMSVDADVSKKISVEKTNELYAQGVAKGKELMAMAKKAHLGIWGDILTLVIDIASTVADTFEACAELLVCDPPRTAYCRMCCSRFDRGRVASGSNG